MSAARDKPPGMRDAIFASASQRGESTSHTGFGIPDGLREALSRPTGAVLYGLEARHREMKEQGIKTVAVPDGRMKVHSRAYALRTRIAALSAFRSPQIA